MSTSIFTIMFHFVDVQGKKYLLIQEELRQELRHLEHLAGKAFIPFSVAFFKPTCKGLLLSNLL